MTFRSRQMLLSKIRAGNKGGIPCIQGAASSAPLGCSTPMKCSFRGVQRKRRPKGKEGAKESSGREKKMQRAELTLTKTSHFQSSIPTSMCGCVPVLSCSHLAQSSLMSSWRLEVHVEFDFGVSLRFCSWESCQEQQGSRLCLSQVVP